MKFTPIVTEINGTGPLPPPAPSGASNFKNHSPIGSKIGQQIMNIQHNNIDRDFIHGLSENKQRAGTIARKKPSQSNLMAAGAGIGGLGGGIDLSNKAANNFDNVHIVEPIIDTPSKPVKPPQQ